MNEIDWIRRSEVIEALDNTDWYHQNRNKDMVSGANSNEHQAWYKAEDVYKALESVPSTQPEQLTDPEQRIFLAAMERERKVCKQVDEEWRDCREPYEDSLVRICSEIKRKVKGALWTI